jgi:hypothetical protein
MQRFWISYWRQADGQQGPDPLPLQPSSGQPAAQQRQIKNLTSGIKQKRSLGNILA